MRLFHTKKPSPHESLPQKCELGESGEPRCLFGTGKLSNGGHSTVESKTMQEEKYNKNSAHPFVTFSTSVPYSLIVK